MDKATLILMIVTIFAIVTMVFIFSLVCITLYLREVVSIKGHSKVDNGNTSVEAELSITSIKESKEKEPSHK